MKKSAVHSLNTRNKYIFRNSLSTFHVFRKALTIRASKYSNVYHVGTQVWWI